MTIRYIISLCVIGISLLVGACSKTETSGDAPAIPSLKVVELFDGQTLDGWDIVNNGQFSVEAGLLKVNQGTGWLRSKEVYGDFTLKIEVRFLEAGANSGIFVRTAATSKDDENGWPNNGLQLNCYDSLEGKSPLACPVNYGIPDYESSIDHEALAAAYKPVGEWYDYQITCLGESVTTTLNGHTIAVINGVKNLDGHVGIQGEHGLLEFRKFEIELVQ